MGKPRPAANAALESLSGFYAAVTEPWDLPIQFQQVDGKLEGHLDLRVDCDLSHTSIEQAKARIRAVMKSAILTCMPWPDVAK